jgi:hypothetical protein
MPSRKRHIAEPQRTSLIVQVQLAEFNQLREEINAYHEAQKDDVHFAMLVLAGAFAVIFSPQIISGFSEIFLIFPIIFTTLAFAYLDLSVRIVRHAAYIHHSLRTELTQELGTRNLLLWEIYKRYQSRKSTSDGRISKSSRLIRTARRMRNVISKWDTFLDFMRIGQFVAPSLFTLVVYVAANSASWSVLKTLALSLSALLAISPMFFFRKAKTSSGIDLREKTGDLLAFERGASYRT